MKAANREPASGEPTIVPDRAATVEASSRWISGSGRANGGAGVTAIWDRRLVLVTGKGGVGKTAVTAALARAAHAAGKRVMVAEVTPDVHTPSPVLSLFGHPRPKGEDPVDIAPRLRGVRLAPTSGHRILLRKALKVGLLVDTALKSAALTRFLSAAPTFPEIGILFQLVTLLRDAKDDHLIVDLPATGHAVSLVSLPKTVVRVIPSGLIGESLSEVLAKMSDPKHTRAVVVTLPEQLPVSETVELVAALGAQGLHVGAAVLNRVPSTPFLPTELSALRAWIDENNPPLLGAKELRKLERALQAKETFYAQVPNTASRSELPLFDGLDDRQVVERMAKVLGEVS